MKIFILTAFIEPEIQTTWIKFIQEKLLVEFNQTGIFNDILFTELIEPKSDHQTYSLQFFSNDETFEFKEFEVLIDDFINANSQFGSKVLFFKSELKTIKF